MTRSDKAVVVAGIKKSFGSVQALRDVSFEVERGEVLGLLGPNGAGKTTTVNILSTLIKPDSGRALIAGHDVVADPAGVRRALMLTGQHAALDDLLTGRENLLMFGRLQGLTKKVAKQRAQELLEQFDLVQAGDRAVGNYSGGMKRRIDIACGLVVRPEVVFLDEPTTGLDPRSRQAIWELVTDFKEAGIATLLTTQYLEEADQLADHVVIVDHGRSIATGTPGELKGRAGRDRVEIRVRDAADLSAARDVLAPLGVEEPTVDEPNRRVAVGVEYGTDRLSDAIRILAERGIDIDDVGLRRPTLDEVFLHLTGTAVELEAA